jgi:hypothetical protein
LLIFCFIKELQKAKALKVKDSRLTVSFPNYLFFLVACKLFAEISWSLSISSKGSVESGGS